MEEQNAEINHHKEMLPKSLDFGKKKIIYHENAHLILSYFFGMSCGYVDYTVRANPEFKGNHIAVDFKSNAHAAVQLTPLLENYLFYLHQGGTPEAFAKLANSTEKELTESVMAYLTMLYAGYEAERFFFGGEEYQEIRNYIDTYSQDLTTNNIEMDETKATLVLSNLKIVPTVRTQIREKCLEVIRRIFNEEKIKQLFEELYTLATIKNRVSRQEIEEILMKHDFNNWSKEMIIKLNQ